MTDDPTTKTYSLMELASETGLPPRTVRYYFARHLMPEPRQRGRDAFYDEEHLAVLRRIRDLAAGGMTLAEIGEVLKPAPKAAFPVESWRVARVAEGVVVQVRADVDPSWHCEPVGRGVVLLMRDDLSEDEILVVLQTLQQGRKR
jgi:DNA-binding transcriptional MerR regulator